MATTPIPIRIILLAEVVVYFSFYNDFNNNNDNDCDNIIGINVIVIVIVIK